MKHNHLNKALNESWHNCSVSRLILLLYFLFGVIEMAEFRTQFGVTTFVKTTKEEAIAKGMKSFYTGIMCKHGHIADRCVKYGTCRKCNSIKSQKAYRSNPEAVREYYKENPDIQKRANEKSYAKKKALALGDK